jgi:2-methylcitrate dehydratase
MRDGTTITDEMAVANAHPRGAQPFARADYIRKFTTLTEGIIAKAESDRFLDAVQDLARLGAGTLDRLNVALPEGSLLKGRPGIF